MIVFFSNFINHHQKPVADELYELTGHQYIFVETMPMPDSFKRGGYTDYSTAPYVLRVWENKENWKKAEELAKVADVAFFAGCEVLRWEVLRARSTNQLSFEVGERWLKRGWVNLFSPRLLKNQWYYHTQFGKKNFYRLCAGAFAAGDVYKLHSYRGKCYKWGYFTSVSSAANLTVLNNGLHGGRVTMMWCARYLKWKHPELPILLAKNLKSKGYSFVIDMYGSGNLFDLTYSLSREMGVADVVNFCGNCPNEQILQTMREHSIFLFTSDRKEGWGAVINEAMGSGCVVVGSDAVGAVPFLIADKQNGCTFRSAKKNSGFSRTGVCVDNNALDSLTEIVEWLLNHPEKMVQMSKQAYITMQNDWSPKSAAANLIKLINALQIGKDTPITEGPCSKAKP